jgi:hypothetical protein
VVKYKQQTEEYLASKVESMLAKVLGAGNSVVRVSATINTEAATMTEERFDPEGQVPRQEVTVEDSASTNETSAEQAQDSVKQAVSESAAAAASTALAVPVAKAETEVSGSRQAEGESTSPDEKPFLHACLVDESKAEEPEPPEMMTISEDMLERPIKMDEESATLLATETWNAVEKDLPTATDADLKVAQRVACAAAWQELLDQN